MRERDGPGAGRVVWGARSSARGLETRAWSKDHVSKRADVKGCSVLMMQRRSKRIS